MRNLFIVFFICCIGCTFTEQKENISNINYQYEIDKINSIVDSLLDNSGQLMGRIDVELSLSDSNQELRDDFRNLTSRIVYLESILYPIETLSIDKLTLMNKMIKEINSIINKSKYYNKIKKLKLLPKNILETNEVTELFKLQFKLDIANFYIIFYNQTRKQIPIEIG